MIDNNNPLGDIQIDTTNLYREESFTDLKVGQIRRLTPVTETGEDDPSRNAIYSGTTTIMTPGGSLPLTGDIEAADLKEAIEKFPETIQQALQKLQEDMARLQQEQAQKIVTPDELRGGNDLII